ncbi:MAG: HD-GYP domain-containing protein [Lachnospiraceae bacterium]|nr:HD-GYP domain-containing protein [Lachnospiraceae bacterium]
MKKILVRDLKPGMITAEDIYSINGQLILSRNYILTPESIERLESFAIYSIRISDRVSTPLQEIINQGPSAKERVRANPDFVAFKASFEENVETLKTTLNQVVTANSNFDAENVISQTLSLIGKSEKSSISMMDMLLNMRDYDDSTYAHMVNCSILCNIFAGWLRMEQDERILATTCGLFHDIGNLRISEEILKKPGSLNFREYEVVKRHTLEGYSILSSQNLHPEVKNSALMHHERCDGTGYPYGFTAEKISRFTKLVAIVDVYNAMTSKRVYRRAICPFAVVEDMQSKEFSQYDPDMMLTFLKNVSNSFIGNRVRLSNGIEGEVVFIHQDDLAHPTIQCGQKFLDLSMHRDIKVTAII